MPKDTINYPKGNDPQVEVNWGGGAEGVVQLSITVNKKFLRDLLVDEDPILAGDELTLFTAPLTRHETQNGIRALRRARNSVFGEDE